jgi:YVTN family beta-propeller protein
LKAFALPRTLCNIFLRNDNFPGALIVTADRGDNQISIIDAKTFVRKGTVKVGAHPFGVTIDPQGARAYTANVESNDVSVVDLKEAKLLGNGAVGKRRYAVALAKGRGFSTPSNIESV